LKQLGQSFDYAFGGVNPEPRRGAQDDGKG
jgi:hypothetical protein